MVLNFLFDVFRQNPTAEAVVWRDQTFLYGDLLNRVDTWRGYLREHRIGAGEIAAVEADFSPNAIALMLALIQSGCIVVPLTSSIVAKKAEFMEIAGVEALVEFDKHDEPRLTHFERSGVHELIQQLRDRRHPGLILFS